MATHSAKKLIPEWKNHHKVANIQIDIPASRAPCIRAAAFGDVEDRENLVVDILPVRLLMVHWSAQKKASSIYDGKS